MMQRVGRLQGAPETIALGCACGMFASFTPFVGFHFIVAAVLAFLTRSSIVASAIGTFIGNPLTFPFIWYGTYYVGNAILGNDGEFSLATLQSGFADMMSGIFNFSSSAFSSAFDAVWPLFKPMLVGSIPLGVPTAIIGYFVLKRIVIAYQEKRRQIRGLSHPI